MDAEREEETTETRDCRAEGSAEIPMKLNGIIHSDLSSNIKIARYIKSKL